MYPPGLSDSEWTCLQHHLPADLSRRHWPQHSLRTILDAISYLLRDFPPWQTVSYRFRRFRLTGARSGLLTALRQAERRRVRKQPRPGAAIMDAQSVKTVEESARIGGYDGHTRVKGRTRQLLVDTLGLPISIAVTPAGARDTVGAWRLLAGLKPLVPRLEKIWADRRYTSGKLARWCEGYRGWDREIVGRDPEARGFAVQPRRRVVEPGALLAVFARLVRDRRLRIDDERKVQTSETLVEVAFIRLLLRRLARCTG